MTATAPTRTILGVDLSAWIVEQMADARRLFPHAVDYMIREVVIVRAQATADWVDVTNADIDAALASLP